jgi:dTDP-4-amino-4,6-dideoxygalactose transaminase
VYYPVPAHLQPALAHLGHQAGDFPVSERAARECLALPVYPELPIAAADEVMRALVASLERLADSASLPMAEGLNR